MDKTTPKLSIITVNLNNVEGLRKTLDSVACQTFTDYEHLIIDGGSADASIEIIKEYETKYNGVKDGLYWVSESDKGIYNAMNKGIMVAKGEYLQFLNSGDYFYNNNSLVLFSELTHNNPFLIIGDDMIEDENGIRKKHYHPDRASIFFLMTGAFAHAATFYNRKLFKDFGLFDESYKIGADYEYYLRLFLLHKIEYAHINQPITVFTTGGISGDKTFELIRRQEREKSQLKYIPDIYLNDLKTLIKKSKEFDSLTNSRLIKYAKGIRQIIVNLRSFK
ncbi:glycosyltransferase family 2 protein [Natronoflexus pectinivorans]|uniref:Glycosyl transferase family 2 n=1 Tax=Natronoflexus pectinivorans TaxID=682526 RepID=A0A4R2GG18_9BACT|nr:glycosyltransferase family 2 protein [Natronoflexus pectinivorans]TCO06901.1 glycosyl transferase family 2 [Natronoflexus pectinivorans]